MNDGDNRNNITATSNSDGQAVNVVFKNHIPAYLVWAICLVTFLVVLWWP